MNHLDMGTQILFVLVPILIFFGVTGIITLIVYNVPVLKKWAEGENEEENKN